MKRMLLLLALLLSLTCVAHADTTLMMYMCGTDLQSDCIKDLKEMCSAGSLDHVRIVVLAGGASKWSDSRLKANRLNLFTIDGGTFSPVTDWGRDSMGSADTLTKFISYAWQNYRSDRNLLVLWDHGGGTAEGICFDEVHNDDGLTLLELDKALSAAAQQNKGFRLDLLGCDACLMAGYELAVVAADHADYFVASEEIEPSIGWYYTDWLKALNANDSMSTPDLCRAIVDAYSSACKRSRQGEYTTLSAIDLAKLYPLRTDMEQLAVYLQDALAHGQLATISRAVKRMYALGSFDSTDATNDMYDLSDLLDLAEQFAPDTVAAARAHLADAVLYNYSSGDVPSASGLAVYIPQGSRTQFADAMKGYDLSAIIPNYIGFVSALAGDMNSTSYTFTAQTPITQTITSVASQFAGYIPCGTYNAETGTVPSFIAGSAAQQGNVISGYVVGDVPAFIAGSANAQPKPGVTASPSVPSFIAGSATTTAAPAVAIAGSASPAVSINGVPSFIAGSANAPLMQPPPASTDFAFSMQLNRRDLDNLSYVEGALFMDRSTDEALYLVDLGYLRNSWVDWANGNVYSSFDGTWPKLDGQMVVLYDRSVTAIARRSLIPVTVNGKETCLVVSFETGSTEGHILGHNAGLDDNGLLIRYTEPLKPGDVIVPQYTMYTGSWDDMENDEDPIEVPIEGTPIIWQDGMTVNYEPMASSGEPIDYQFAFYLNDIFGDYDVSDFIPFSI